MQVINCLESIGGEMNAFTNKQATVFYAALQKEHFTKAVDLLSDIVFHSTYPQHEIDKEVEVICDEIESYEDTPAELIFDDFENAIFRGHPLGHNILGTAENVRRFTTADAVRFTSKYYTPQNAIFFCYGDIEFKRLVRLIEKHSPKTEAVPLMEATKTTWQGVPTEREIVIQRDTHQAHVMIGCRGYDINDPRRMALYLLNNILGGPGLNARLNIALRERYGLVYSVESTMVNYSDTGMWATYFGCDPKDVQRCRRLIRKELDKVMDKPLSEAQLTAAKRQIKGQIALACDNHESFAIDFGKSFLHYGWEKDIQALYDKLDVLTAADLQEVAKELFKEENLTTLIYK